MSPRELRRRNPPAARKEAPRRFSFPRRWAIGIFLVAATAAVYAQVIHHDFVSLDDTGFVTENPMVQAGLSWEGVRWAFTTTHASLWHPLAWISLMADAQLYGLDAGGFHLTNLLLHVANSLLLFGLLAALTGHPWRSGFAAALFALHPLHVESVAWVTERKDVLCAFFWLLALWAYRAYAARPGPGRYLLVAACHGAALMSKPMAVTLPVVLLLLDYWPLGRWQRAGGVSVGRRRFGERWRAALWAEKAPLLAMSAAVCVLAVVAMPAPILSTEAMSGTTRIQKVIVAYAFYLAKMIWPSGLCVSYPVPDSYPVWVVGLALGSLVAVSALVARAAARRPYLATGWLWYLVTLLPVSGVVPFGNRYFLGADRFAYIPLVGLYIMIAWLAPELLSRWRRQRAFLAAAAGLILAALALLTWQQAAVWRSSASLFRHALSARPDNWPAMNGRALGLAAEGNFDQAMALWREALRIRPDNAELRINMAGTLLVVGHVEEAIAEFREALRIAPTYAKAHLNLAGALQLQGQLAEAQAHYERALELAPRYPDAHNNLGLLFAAQGDTERALAHYREALRQRPDFLAAQVNLGALLLKRGDAEEAAAVLGRALELNPGHWQVHVNLGAALARQGKTEQAIAHYRRALALRPDLAEAHYRLGVAYLEQGNRQAAHKQREALAAIHPPLAAALLREIEASP